MANLEVSRSMRLDQYVVQEKPRISRAFATKLINEGKITVNGKTEKPGYKLRENDDVKIDFDEASLDVIPEIDLPVLYEDDDVIVINKPAGVISHARGLYWDEPSVASFVRQKTSEMSGERAGIVHRLDRATSGIMICAKNPAAMTWLQKQFSQRKVTKTYLAVVQGRPKQDEAVINMPIERNPKAPATFRVGANGKVAITHYKVIKANDKKSLLELKPETGRTHQLRVHLARTGNPIIGDPLYGSGKHGDRLFLQAHALEIVLPNREKKTFTVPMPKEFMKELEC